MALQGVRNAVGTAEGIGEHGVGGLVARGVLALVAVLLCAEEGAGDSVWPTEGAALRGIHRRA
jgi:hypothetical protein